jgi:hypothetical protein
MLTFSFLREWNIRDSNRVSPAPSEEHDKHNVDPLHFFVGFLIWINGYILFLMDIILEPK